MLEKAILPTKRLISTIQSTAINIRHLLCNYCIVSNVYATTVDIKSTGPLLVKV